MPNESISLAELAKVLKTTKSRCNYWAFTGLLKPRETVSGMKIFDRDETIARVKSILKMQKDGMRVEEIRKALNQPKD